MNDLEQISIAGSTPIAFTGSKSKVAARSVMELTDTEAAVLGRKAGQQAFLSALAADGDIPLKVGDELVTVTAGGSVKKPL